MPDDPRYYMDYTGTGNSLNMRHPHVLQLIMDSLRYWVLEMHVDGFRFDLAVDARPRAPRRRPPLGLLRHHPAGPGDQPGQADRRAVGRRRGRLPGRQLPAAVVGVERQVPRHACATTGAARTRRSASSPTASPAAPTSTPATGRRPSASINFITAHDGFTLRDLVSYNDKHNEANGEDNRDGDEPQPLLELRRRGADRRSRRSTRLRARQQRNFLATLLLSQGMPMLLRRRRDGAHPAAATTTPTARTTRSPGSTGRRRRRPARRSPPRLIALRREHPVFRRRRWFQGRPIHGEGVRDIGWFRPDGEQMTDEDWQQRLRQVARRSSSTATPSPSLDARGEPVRRRQLLRPLQRPPRAHRLPPPRPPPLGGALAQGARHRQAASPKRRRRSSPPAARCRSPGGRWWC